MLVTLIGKESIRKIVLPKVPIGNYWLTDRTGENEKNLINIQGHGKNWQIASDNNVKLLSMNDIILTPEKLEINSSKTEYSIIEKVILEDYGIYCAMLKNSSDVYIIYCSPVNEDFVQYDIQNTSLLTIGNNPNSIINYSNLLINSEHTKIFYDKDKWHIENYDTKLGVFVNNIPIYNNVRALKNWDIIYIMGLKIIIVGNSLYINNPMNRVKINNYYLTPRPQENIGNIPSQTDDDDDVDIYQEKDYFSRIPRITNILEHEVIKIDAPPNVQEKEETPMTLLLGSEVSMGIMMLVSMYSSIDGLANNNASIKEVLPTLIVSAIMLVSMILFPILNVEYQKQSKYKYELKRQQKYKKYINSKINEIDRIMHKQRAILLKNYITPEYCEDVIINRNVRLWERKIEDADFLAVRLGVGEVPLDVDIQIPEPQFTMENDNLLEILNSVGDKSKMLQNAPIVYSLSQRNISAIIGNNKEQTNLFMQSLIMQLITFQSYEDLQIVCLSDDLRKNNWNYLKMLPHVWDSTKQIRFCSDEYMEMKEISGFLSEELKERKQNEEDAVNYKNFSPYYLLIIDDYKKAENLKIVKDILKSKVNYGFSILFVAENLTQLPTECKNFIVLDKKEGMIIESEVSSTNQTQFEIEKLRPYDYKTIAQKLSNIPIKYTLSENNLLPNSYSFLEMYNVGTIERLNTYERWKKNDSTISLQALIGVDASRNPIQLDIHEKFHGPHGLIAGSTGSGKSEFIITYILSLAINYHPDDVAFVLIDYKGGGLAGAFKKKNIQLPHLVGTITNIDTADLQRSLDSIQSELRKRQKMFNEARNKTDESTMDIYKYQKLYHEGIVSEPIPHLLIICDEFAELKQQQEDFMDELISVARIGRSLGVHLILATQKPAGIVNDEIRSNSKFAICLKVQDREDSVDVIRRPDAVNLKNVGQFYMNVGNEEFFVLGQSAWSGAPYVPSDVTKKKVDNSIEFVSNIGSTIKKVDDYVVRDQVSSGDQLTNIVKYLYEIAEENNIEPKQLWLDNIPENIYLRNIRKKYNIENDESIINPVIGEFDDPFNQRQGVVNLNLTSGGNTIIYGNAESGKETLLSTIIYDSITNYSSDVVQFYVLDFGSEALKIFKGTPHVGDIAFVNDEEKIDRFFEMLKKEIRERKTILSEYNGDFSLYQAASNQKMPIWTVIINNYEAFAENYLDKYEETFQMLTREGTKCGITFIITTSTYQDVRYRLSQNFKQSIVLQLNNDDDYYNIFENVGKKRPSRIFGRGLVKIEKEIYEFQTAKICETENYNVQIKHIIAELQKYDLTIAKPIPIMPNYVDLESVRSYFEGISKVPIGIEKRSLEVYSYDFSKNLVNIISAKSVEDAVRFFANVLNEVEQIKDINITVVDAERILMDKKTDLHKEFESLKTKVKKENGFNLCLIIGIDKLLTDLEIEEDEFLELLKTAEEKENFVFVIIENPTRLKNHEYDSWYKNYISGDSGIWVGNGIEDQYLFSLNVGSSQLANNCGTSFGYVIKGGETKIIKLLGVKGENVDE